MSKQEPAWPALSCAPVSLQAEGQREERVISVIDALGVLCTTSGDAVAVRNPGLVHRVCTAALGRATPPATRVTALHCLASMASSSAPARNGSGSTQPAANAGLMSTEVRACACKGLCCRARPFSSYTIPVHPHLAAGYKYQGRVLWVKTGAKKLVFCKALAT